MLRVDVVKWNIVGRVVCGYSSRPLRISGWLVRIDRRVQVERFKGPTGLDVAAKGAFGDCIAVNSRTQLFFILLLDDRYESNGWWWG